MATKKAGQEERDLVVGVIRLANLLTRRLAPIFERSGITPQQWGVISALATAEQPTTLAALARTMLVSKQNMTGMVARLEHLGLAHREDDPNDLRSSHVTVTRRGRQLYEKAVPAYEEWRDSLGRDLSERDRATLVRGIDRLIAELGE